jgi:predicted metal-dependent phosphoesterase TrpH
MIRVETHQHTIYSPDSLTTPKKLLEVCQRKGIDCVIVTDHNNITGAQEAKELDPERVIIGEEIMTTKGEILAFYVKEEIPSLLSPEETIQLLREQDAFISVSHPLDEMRKGAWEMADLLAIAPLVDAIETFNARCMFPSYNRAAQAFAKEHNLPGTAGSDAHAPFEIGRANLLLPEFQSAEELKQVIRQAQFRVHLSSPLVHFYSRYAVYRKKLNSKFN